ncbi:hypothetical protein BD410DRAFT_786540 [Rickenella mellea]|uniref:Dihydroorotate dehydrogenase (quinone), mitochondrial n=1 Tax=Rickenella mellea TaxID=50990 RepID=A0A4Y7Q9V1_9AGAM|nr:hypothetical protein BD410DRAFT_786540 [Rickenella mellea]
MALRLSSRLHRSLAQRPPLSRGVVNSQPTASPNSLRTGIFTTVALVSGGLFAVYYFDARSALHRYFVTPLIRYGLDPETGHKVAVKVLRSGLAPRDHLPDDERLKVEIWGEEMSNPIGLAAGFDKNGEAIDGLFNLGFGWVEIGSVTPKPQPGNPPPRVFTLPEDAAIINRYGFPSEGATSVLARLRARIPSFRSETSNASLRSGALLAINLGKNKSSAPDSINDFLMGVRLFGKYADALVVNVSSPNTPGLRGLQSRGMLEELLAGITEARNELPVSPLTSRRPRIILKIAPDLTEDELKDIAEAVSGSSIDGVIVSNTTIQRPESLTDLQKIETGGLSGTPLKPLSLRALRTLRTHLPARIPLIGCGGISSGADALEYARAGATAVQLYTGFGYDGVGACRRIKDQLAEELRREGTTWADVVAKSVRELSKKENVKVGRRAWSEGVEDSDSEVGVLVKEALQIQEKLEELGRKMGIDSKTPVAT